VLKLPYAAVKPGSCRNTSSLDRVTTSAWFVNYVFAMRESIVGAMVEVGSVKVSAKRKCQRLESSKRLSIHFTISACDSAFGVTEKGWESSKSTREIMQWH
jgi:hypothetical protein